MTRERLNRIFAISVAFVVSLLVFESKIYAMPPVNKTILSNHLILLHSEDHSLPFVTLQLLVDAGSGKDPAGKQGLSYLTARGILLGTLGHTAAALSEELDFLGASLDSSAGKDYAVLSLRVLKANLDKGLALFMETLAKPTFPTKELKQEAEKTLALIQSQKDQPGKVAEKEFLKTLFLSGPYRYPPTGKEDTVSGLTRADVLAFYEEYYHPNNCILAVVGDITAEEVKNNLIPLLETLPVSDIPTIPLETVLSKGPVTIRIDRTITQANIILGTPGISRSNPDFYALTVMNYILGGGGFASRLFDEVRNKRGLAYSVASFFDTGKYPGSFQVVLQTKNSSAGEAISLVLQEMKRIKGELVSDKELEEAKKYLIGSFPLRMDTQSKFASLLLHDEYYGLGLDYPEKYSLFIKAVTRDDILRAAKSYLHPETCILILVGDLKEVGVP